MEKTYWQNLDDYGNIAVDAAHRDELEETHKEDVLSMHEGDYDLKASRRDFLKFFGFSLTAATLAAGCERPVQKAIPYLIKPEEIIPGKANHYASSFFDGDEYAGIVVKVRDGRPIKIEGNELSKINMGGTSARVQASILELYDIARPQFPMKDGKQITWKIADAEIPAKLKEIAQGGGSVVFLTGTIISPSSRKVITDFQKKYPATKWVTYDAVSSSAILQANEKSFGSRFIPAYQFDKADLIISFNADFLGTWLSSVQYTKLYMQNRRLTGGNKKMSHHIQFETNFTITGSKADKRFPIKPSDEKRILLALLNKLRIKAGTSEVKSVNSPVDIDFLVNEIVSNNQRTLLVSGSNDLECQLLVNEINNIAGSFGNTIDVSSQLKIRQGIDSDIVTLNNDMNQGKVDALFIVNANPVYTLAGKKFDEGLKKVKLSVSLNDKKDETSLAVNYFCPDNHYLESWNDFEPQTGHLSLAQPVIQPIFSTRQWQESILKWSDQEVSYYDYLKSNWESEIFSQLAQTQLLTGGEFWQHSLRDGVCESKIAFTNTTFSAVDITELASIKTKESAAIEGLLYESIAFGSGKHSNNPWLAEMPDPMTKVSWDNFVSVSPKMASEKGWSTGSVVKINNTLQLPVVIQPGHAYNSVSISLGYGHTYGGKVAEGLGANGYLLSEISENSISSVFEVKTIDAVGEIRTMAQTQMHDSMEGRPIVRECDLSEYIENPAAGNEMHAEFEKKHLTLYEDAKYEGYHWGLMIDLNACTSCGACIIACQSENNIPVVGKEQIARNRNMYWIRVDRYYEGNPENPKVVHQPIMCQHCDHAPCENVCPVSATNHSNEGLNQIAYNRCIGTKYCINNCPYKVRRFNWFQFAQNMKFDYNMNTDLGRLVLNPDVTVRERGVVEKCSFCVQRIQEKKLDAKLENRSIRDGELKTACEQVCPAGALVFGNTLDKESRVSKLHEEPRNYHLLEELHTLPSVGYLTLVRNAKNNKV